MKVRPRAAMLIILAAGLCAAAAWALTNPQTGGRGCAQMERYVGSWSGSQTCKTGKYGVTFALARGPQGPTARYSVSSSDSESGRRPSGEVRFFAGPRPGTCAAVVGTPVGELSFLVNFAASGRRLSYRAVSLLLMGAAMPPPGSVSGSADLDQPLARAQYRFISALPMAEDTCGGTLRRAAR